jgi:LysM repeat protein
VTYGARKVFLLDILPVVVLFVVPLFAHAGVFSAIAGLLSESPEVQEKITAGEGVDDIELLRAATNHDPNPAKGGGDVLIEDGALVADYGPLGGEDAVKAKETNGEISIYIVREGDSLSQIAEMFGVSVNTILWANSIPKATGIKEGDELIILPITGVRHIVKKGDTMKSIAEKYRGDVTDILAYNQLDTAEDIKVGDTIVIPGGEIEAPKEAPKKSSSKGAASSAAGVARSGFTHPVPGAIRTQGIHGYNGVDLGAPVGTPVRAAAAGEVIISRSSGWNGGYGQYIVVKHPNGTQTLYAHLSSNGVGVGTKVAQGQTIGAVGNTGRSTGSHLHFEVRGAKNPF